MRRMLGKLLGSRRSGTIRTFKAIQMWQRATMKQRAFAIVGLVALLSGLLAPVAFRTYADQTHTGGRASQGTPHVDPRAAAQRFQQQHFGKHKPTASAYLKALRQAAKLPKSPLGGASGTVSTQRNQTAAATSLATPTTVPGAWLPLGPQPLIDTIDSSLQGVVLSGDVTGIAVNPADANDVWLATSTGGVWHTTDGGTSWTPMTDSQPTLAIGSIAIDPTNSSIVYAGTGDANNIFGGDYPGLGVLRTTDGGQTWTLLDTADFEGLAIGRIAVDPTNPQVLLLSAGWDGSFLGNPDKTGIWRSTDGGSTWTQTLSDPGQVFPDAGTDVVFDPADPQIAFAGLGNLYALNATTASGVYKSTDNGQTWTQLTTVDNGLLTGSDVERVSLTISPDGKHLYAALTDGDYRDFNTGSPSFGALLNGLYASGDTGATWTAGRGGGTTRCVGCLDWWYASLIAIDPSDPTGNTVYLGSTSPYRTTDGGANWTLLPLNFFQHALTFTNNTSSSFYIGTEGGIWSGDKNTTWTGTPTGNFVNRNGTAPHGLALGRVNSGSIGTAGSNPQLYASSPDWWGVAQYPAGPVSAPAQWNLTDYYAFYTTAALVDYTDNAIVYDESRAGGVEFDQSTNGGSGWTPISDSTQFDPSDTANYVLPFVMSPIDPTELFVATDRVYLNFTPISPVLDAADPCATPADSGCVPLSALAVAPSDDNTIYVGDDNGNMYATPDGGTTWNPLTAPCASCGAWITSLAVDPTDALTVYATLDTYALSAGQHVFKSIDGGSNWTDISTTLPDAPFMSLAVDPSNANLVVAASDAGIFASEDAGATWGQFGTGLPNVLPNQVFFAHDGDGLFVATDGRGVWKLPSAHLQASPASVSLTTQAGNSPADQIVTIQNTGGWQLNWTLTSSLPSWLSVSPTSGSIPAGGSQPVTLQFSIPPSDPPQTYNTTLTFRDPNADGSPLSVPVTVVSSNGATKWYFAEGYTGGSFSEYLTLANPNPTAANVQVQYYLGTGGAPITKTYVVSPHSRLTKSVNQEIGNGQSVSMVVTSLPVTNYSNGVPIVAERPMYFAYTGLPGYTIPGGTDVLGATQLGTSFDFGYLDTIEHDTFLTVLNQNVSDMTVTIHYFDANGAMTTKTHTVLANSRGTIHVNDEQMASGSHSALVTLSEPGLVERPMYLKDSTTGYFGAADVIGVSQPLSTWYFAEGHTSNTFSERYIVSNPNSLTTADVVVTYLKSDGTTVSDSAMIAPGAQHIFSVNAVLGSGVDNSAVVSAVDASHPSTPVNVLAERFISFKYGSKIPGATDVLGAAQPSRLFLFAEGYTGTNFAEYLTLENPSATQTATVQVTYLLQSGAPVVRTYTVAPLSRYTVFTNAVVPNQQFSMQVLSDVPIVAERPMYFDYQGKQTGGTDIIGYQP